MMPSRGLHALKGRRLRVDQLQVRNLSSATTRRLPSQMSRHGLSLSSPTFKSIGKNTIRSPAALQSARYASTWWSLDSSSWNTTDGSAAPTSPPAAEDAAAASTLPPTAPADGAGAAASSPPTTHPTAPAGEPASFSNLDTITLDNLDTIKLDNIDPSTVLEGIGYLKAIGLDYGYGVTSSIQLLLETIHFHTGLPWWASIATTAVAIRLAMFPLFLRSSDQGARQIALQPVMKPLTDQMTEARKSKDQAQMMAAYTQLSAVRKRAGLKLSHQFLPIIIQGVIGYCGFRLIRGMASLPVPALVTDGPGWISDLTVSDPYLILPLAMAGSIHLVVRMGGESGAASEQVGPNMKLFMLYGMPGVAFLGTAWLAAAVNVWFIAGGVISIAQSTLLRQPWARERFGITQFYRHGAGDKPGEGFWGKLASESFETKGQKEREKLAEDERKMIEEGGEQRDGKMATVEEGIKYEAPTTTTGSHADGDARAGSSAQIIPPRQSKRAGRVAAQQQQQQQQQRPNLRLVPHPNRSRRTFSSTAAAAMPELSAAADSPIPPPAAPSPSPSPSASATAAAAAAEPEKPKTLQQAYGGALPKTRLSGLAFWLFATKRDRIKRADEKNSEHSDALIARRLAKQQKQLQKEKEAEAARDPAAIEQARLRAQSQSEFHEQFNRWKEQTPGKAVLLDEKFLLAEKARPQPGSRRAKRKEKKEEEGTVKERIGLKWAGIKKREAEVRMEELLRRLDEEKARLEDELAPVTEEFGRLQAELREEARRAGEALPDALLSPPKRPIAPPVQLQEEEGSDGRRDEEVLALRRQEVAGLRRDLEWKKETLKEGRWLRFD